VSGRAGALPEVFFSYALTKCGIEAAISYLVLALDANRREIRRKRPVLIGVS
jgi:hypothetical protein